MRYTAILCLPIIFLLIYSCSSEVEKINSEVVNTEIQELPIPNSGELVALIDTSIFRTTEMNTPWFGSYMTFSTPSAATHIINFEFYDGFGKGMYTEVSRGKFSYWYRDDEKNILNNFRSDYLGSSGFLEITKFDRINTLMSGNFDFTLVNKDNSNELDVKGSFSDVIFLDVHNREESINENSEYFFAKLNDINELLDSSFSFGEIGESADGNHLDYFDFTWSAEQGTSRRKINTRWVVKRNSNVGASTAFHSLLNEDISFGKLGDTYQNNTEGLVLTYTDENNILWSSELGTADQLESSVSVIDKIDAGWRAYIKCSINCTLYNELGESLDLTDGKFRFWAAY